MSEVTMSRATVAKAYCANLENLLHDLFGHPVTVVYRIRPVYWTLETLQNTIVDVCGVSWEMIKGRRGVIEVSTARQLYCYFAHVVLKRPLVLIAGDLGKDHTTVIHGRDRIKNAIDVKDSFVMDRYFEIQKRLNQANHE